VIKYDRKSIFILYVPEIVRIRYQQLIKPTLTKSNLAILISIAAIGIFLSAISYQYSTITANEISRIASMDVRSNAKIEAHDLSQILVHSIDSVTNNLQALTNAPPFQNVSDVKTGQVLLNAAQDSTKQLTDGYYWLDKDGRIITWSNIDSSTLKKYKGFNLSDRQFFTVPRDMEVPYYSSIFESPDKIPRLYISYPLINTNTPSSTTNGTETNSGSSTQSKKFGGIIIAAISVQTIGKFLQKGLSPYFISSLGLMDENGVFIYARNHTLVGKNYLSDEFQSTIPEDAKTSYNNVLKRSLGDTPGAEDITFRGNTSTISYQPVLINGKHLWTIFIGSPHTLTSDVGYLIDQQKNFSTIVVATIASISIGMAFLILSWNRRLVAAVNTRTSELKNANQSLIESNRLLATANEQLKVHDRMQKEFINIAAHELRTPIMPILGDAEYMERQFNAGTEPTFLDTEQIRSIIRNAKRLDRLASDILDVTKIESKSLKLHKERFDLNDILAAAVQDVKQQISNNPDLIQNIQVIYNPVNIDILADKGRLYQVVSNLLSNAVKFSEKGSITVEVQKSTNRVTVAVKDTGQGIDPEILPRLFSKFATKSENGTGLGLFISRSIVEAHGGKIWAKNNVTEQGATFTFFIPLDMG
jgi:signal transduction histidine kinase